MAAGAALASAAIWPVRASAGSFGVLLIDPLTLTVLIDNSTFGPFLDDLDLPGLRVVRAGNGGPSNGSVRPVWRLGQGAGISGR